MHDRRAATLSLRARLCASTFVAGLALQPAAALPPPPDAILTNIGGASPTFAGSGAIQDVTLNAARTLLSYYQGFSIEAGETVNYRFANRSDIAIIHNNSESSLKINGALNAFVGTVTGGNVWLLSSSGIMFGKNARVDVGGLIASTAIPKSLSAASGGALDAVTLNFAFDQPGFGTIDIADGASIRATGGTLAFVAHQVTSEAGASITGVNGASALYGAAPNARIRFVRTADNDLDLIDFEVQTAGVSQFGEALYLSGSTHAGNIYLAAVSRSTVMGSVIDASGTLTAQSAANVNGDIVLSAGGGIIDRAPARAPDGNYRVNAKLNDVNAAGSLIADVTGVLEVTDRVTVGGSILATAAAIAGQTLSAGRDIILRAGDENGSTSQDFADSIAGPYGPTGGDIILNGTTTAGDDIALYAFYGGIETGSIALTDLGGDAAGDPLGLLDTAGDGHRLTLTAPLRILLGRSQAGDTLTGGTGASILGGSGVQVDLVGEVRLDSVNAGYDGININIGATPGLNGPALDGNLFVNTLTAGNRIGVATDGNATIGTASIVNPGDVSLSIDAGGAIDLGSASASSVSLTSRSAGIRATTLSAEGLQVQGVTDVVIGTLDFYSDPQFQGFRFGQIGSSAGSIRLGEGIGRIGDHDELNLSASGSVTVDVLGSAAFNVITASGGSIRADAVKLASLDSSGSFIINARAGGLTLTNSRVDGDFTVSAKGGNAGLGDARVAGALTLSGDTISLSGLTGLESGSGTPGSSIAITTTVGGLSLGNVPLAARDSISIASAGDLIIAAAPAGYGYGAGPPTLVAGGDVSLSSAALLRIEAGAGTDAGRDLILAGQRIDTRAQSLSAARDVRVTAVADAQLGSITATRDLLVNVTAGGIGTTGNLLTQTGKLSLTATGDAFIVGASAASDLIAAIGGVLSFGDGTQVSAGRDLLLTTGGIDAAFASLTAGRHTRLAGGDIALGDLTSQGNITVTADSLRYVDITALGSGVFDATVADTLDTRGSLAAGSIRIRGATLANADATGSMTAAAGIDIIASGGARLANLDGGSAAVSVSAGGKLVISGQNQGASLVYASTGDTISLADGQVATSGAIQLSALAGSIDTRDAGLKAATDIIARAGSGIALGAVESGGNGLFETTSGNAGLGSAKIGGGLVLAGATISGTDLEGLATPTTPLTNISITASAGGYGLASFALNASSDVSIRVRDDLDLGSVGAITAGRDVALASDGRLKVTVPLGSGRDLLLAGNSVTTLGQSLDAARDVRIDAVGSAQLGDIAAKRDLTLRAGSIDASTAALTATRAATLTGATVDVGTLESGADTVIAAGNLRYASISALGSGTIAATASGTIETRGALTAESITVMGATLVNSDSTGSMTARNGVIVTAAAAAALGNLDSGSGAVSVTSGNNLAVFGTNSGTALGYASQKGDIALSGSHGATSGSLAATATAGEIDSRSAGLDATTDIILRAASGTIGNANAGGNLDFDTTGTLILGFDRSLGAGGGISIAAATIAGSGAFLAADGGDIRLTSRSGGLQVESLDASRDIILSSAGMLTGGSITAARDVIASSGDISLGSVIGGGSARLTINGGAAFLGSALTGGNLIITGGNGFNIGLGALDIGGNFTLSTSGAATYDAGIRARGSGNADLKVGGSATLTVASYDAANLNIIAGGDITLTSAGTVKLAAIDAGDDARVSGTALAIDNVFAGRIGSVDGEGDGFNIRLSGSTLASRNLIAGTDVVTQISGESRFGDFTCPGMCRASRISAGRDIDLGSGLFTLAPAASPLFVAGRDLIIRQTSAAADLVLPTALTSGRGVTLASDGGLALGGLTVPGPVTLAARFIQIDQLIAGGTTTLTAERIRVGELNVGTTALAAGATLTANGVGSSGAVQIIRAVVFGDLTLASANGNAGLEGGAVAGTLSLTGATAALGQVTGVDARPFVQQLRIRTTTGGFASTTVLGAATDIALDIAGDAELAGVTAGGNLTALVGGQLRLAALPPVTANGFVDIGAASILAGGSQIGASGSVTITSNGDTVLGSVTAGTGAANALTVTSGGTLRFGGSGFGRIEGGLAAGGRVAISAASIAGGNGDINAGEDIRLNATGSIAVDTLSAGDDLILASADTHLVRGTARGSGPDSEGNGANIRLSGGSASAYNLNAQKDIIANLSGTLALGNPDCRGSLPCDIGSATAGGVLQLSAGGFAFTDGFAALGVLRAGSDIVLTSAGDLRFAGGFSAGRDITITTGGELALGDLTAVNALRFDSRGAIIAGALRAGGDIGITGNSHAITSSDAGGTTQLTSRADSSIDAVRSRNGLTVTGARTLTISDASVGGAILVDVGGGSLGQVRGWQDDGSGNGGRVASLQTLTVTTTAGDFSLGDSGVAGTATLTSFGRLTLTGLAAAGAVDLRSGGNLEGGAINGSSVTISSSAVTNSSVTAAGDLQINAGSIAVGRLTATGGTVTAIASGQLTADAVTAGGDVTLSATTLTTSALDAGRDLILTATAGDLSATGLVAVRDLILAASGNISGSNAGAGGDATLRAGGRIDLANLATGGSALLLARSGGITLAGARIGGNLDIRADAGRADLTGLNVGNDVFVRAGTIDRLQAGGVANSSAQPVLQTRDISVAALGGGIADADLTAARDIIITSAGNVAVTNASAGQDISIGGTGSATVTTATAQRDLLVTAAGNVLVGDARVGRDLTLSGGLVSLATLGPANIDSGPLLTRNITLVSTATAPGITALDFAGTLTASGDVRLDYASRIVVGGLQAGGAIGVNATSGASIGTTSAGAMVTLTGDSFQVNNISAGSDLIVNASDLRGNSFSAGDDVDIAVRRASVGRIVTTGLGLDNDPGGPLIGSNIRVSGNALTLGTLAAANDLLVSVTVAPLCCDVPGQLVVAGPVQAGRDVRLDADTIRLNGGSAGRDFMGTAAGTLASSGTIAAGRDAWFAGAGVTLDRLTTVGDARLTSGAGVTISGTAIGNDLSVTAETGAVRLAGLDVGRDLLVRAGQIDQLTLAGQGQLRDAILTSLAGGTTLGTIGVGRDLFVTANGIIMAQGLIAGRTLLAQSSGIGIGNASAGGDLSLNAGSGSVQAGDLAAGDDVRLTGGAITIGTVTARDSAVDSEGDGSSIRIIGSSIVTGDLDAAGDVTARSTGALTVGNVRAGRDITLAGLSLGSGWLVQGRSLALTATGGAISGGSFTASGDLALDAATTLTLTGLAKAGGTVTLAGAALVITDADAGSTLMLTARNGAISGGTWHAGGDVVARASGALGFTAINAGGRADLSATTVTGGDLMAASADIVATAGVSFGVARSSGDFSVHGSAIAATSLTGGQDVLLSGTGAISVAGPIRAGRDLVASTASGSLTTIGELDAGRDIRLAADGIGVGAASAKGRVTADARTGDLRIDNVDAGAGIDLTGASVSGGTLVSRGDAMITTAGQVRIATASSIGDFSITAAGIDAGALSAGQDVRLAGTAPILVNGQIDAGRNLIIGTSSGGTRTTGALTAGRDIRVSGDGVEVGSASAGGALVAGAGRGALVLGNVAAVGLVDLQGAAVTSGTLTAGAGATIVAAGAVTLGTAQAGSDFAISAASIDTGALSAGQDVLLTGTAPISIDGRITATRDITISTGRGSATTSGALIAGRNINVAAEGVTIANASAGGDVTADAGGAALRLGDAQAAGTLVLNGSTVNAGTVGAGGRASIRAASTVSLDTASAGGNFAIAASGINAGALAAGQDVLLTGSAPISIDGQIGAIRDISVITSSGSATTNGSLTAGRNISVTANGVGIGNASAGGDLTVAAGSGALASGMLIAGDDITLGGGTLTLGALTATGLGADSEGDGSNIRLTGTAIASGRLQAASDILVTASGNASLGLGPGGGVIAGRDVRLAAATLATGPLVQGRDLVLRSGGALTAGDLTSTAGLVLAANGALVTGTVRAAGDVELTGTSVTAGAITVDGATTVTTTGMLNSGAITATSATLSGGAVMLAGVTARDTIRITGSSIGGALLLTGTDITLNASGEIAPLGTIAARRDLAIRGGNRIAYIDLSAGRDLSLNAPVIAGGRAFASRDLTIIATGSVTGARFEAGRNLLIDPDQPIVADTVIAAGDATLIGASITVQTLDVGGRAALSATAGDISIDAARVTGSTQMVATGRINLGDWRSAALALLAGDLDVRRSLMAASLRVETPRPMVLGGSGTGNGFRLAAADLARLRIGGAAEFFAGTTGAITAPVLPGQQPLAVPTAAGGTLTVESFSYDPGALPLLNLYAGRNFDVSVTGRVTPTLNGGVIRIGDLSVDSLWRPGAILISGGFGSAELAVNCFGDVIAVNSLILLAVNDVVFGSTEFASAVRATAPSAIDVGAGLPSVSSPADNRLYAVTAQLRIDAAGRIVSQNSSAIPGGYVGLLIGGEGAPTANGIMQINGAARVDLTGSLVLPNADLRNGPNLALISGLNGGSIVGSFSFNGCTVGTASCGGSGTTPAETLRVEDYVVPTPGLLVPPAPSVTVLGIDNQLIDSAPVALGTGDGTIIIQRRTTP